MKNKYERKEAPSVRVEIFMAGDISQAKQVCREWCFAVGGCVTIEAVDYIYTGGEEAGFRVGFINYPRFPSDAETIFAQASELASMLVDRLCQHSYSIVAPDRTTWFSRRPA